MKVWRFHDPLDHSFASVHIAGAWLDERHSKRVQPLVIEWEPESDVIGDFTWSPGFADDFVVAERVGQLLLKRFRGFELGPVEMVQNPKLRRPQRVTRRTKPRVWLPYQGPPLCDFWVTAEVDLDLQRSTLRERGKDSETGRPLYLVQGGERIEYFGVFPNLVCKRLPREPGMGVYIAEEALSSVDVFRVRQLPGFIFCKDAVRDFAMERKFTNVDFFEMGEVF